MVHEKHQLLDLTVLCLNNAPIVLYLCEAPFLDDLNEDISTIILIALDEFLNVSYVSLSELQV